MDIVKKKYEGGDSQIVLYKPNETGSGWKPVSE